MSKFKLSGDIRIPKEPIKGIKFSDMQALYDQIKDREPLVLLGVMGNSKIIQNLMVTSNADKYDKIVFDIGYEGPGLTFIAVKRSLDFMRGIEQAFLHVRIKNRIYKVKRLIDDRNIIRMHY